MDCAGQGLGAIKQQEPFSTNNYLKRSSEPQNYSQDQIWLPWLFTFIFVWNLCVTSL